MCDAMNPGWAFTFLAFIYAIFIGVVFLLMKKGMGWRREMEEKKRRKKEEEEERERTEDVESQSNADNGSSNEKEIETQVVGEK